MGLGSRPYCLVRLPTWLGHGSGLLRWHGELTWHASFYIGMVLDVTRPFDSCLGAQEHLGAILVNVRELLLETPWVQLFRQ